MVFSTFLAADTLSLSRPDYASLPTQSKMELLIEGFHEDVTSCIRAEDGAFIDTCQWPGITCDAFDAVTTICWTFDTQEVSMIDLHFLPESVEGMLAQSCHLKGSFENITWPPRLNFIIVSDNLFEGTVDCTALPESLESIGLSSNQLVGSLVLSALPSRLESIDATANRLTGSLNLTRLPASLEFLMLSSNLFHGGIALDCLPESLKALDLWNNALTGPICAVNLPKGLSRVYLDANNFADNACIEIGEGRVILIDRAIRIVKNESGVIIDAGKFYRSELDARLI